MEFYRTYIIEFKTDSGVKYYAGKRVSKFSDCNDDPYTGSGNIITKSLKKYGNECILSIQWFDHESEFAMCESEKMLISEMKMKYNRQCVNIANGGEGGNTLKYASDEEKRRHSENTSKGLNRPDVVSKLSIIRNSPEYKSKLRESNVAQFNDPESRTFHSERVRVAMNRSETKEKMISTRNTSEYKTQQSEMVKESWRNEELRKRRIEGMLISNSSSESKANRSSAQKKRMRVGPIWDNPLYSMLWKYWNETNRMSHCRFRTTYIKKFNPEIDIPNLKGIVDHFNRVYNQEEELHHAIIFEHSNERFGNGISR